MQEREDSGKSIQYPVDTSRGARLTGLLIVPFGVLLVVYLLAVPAFLQKPGFDFSLFMDSGAALARGDSPYAVASTFHDVFGDHTLYNLSTPVLLPLLAAVSQAERQAAWVAWYVVSFAIYLLAVIISRRCFRSPSVVAVWSFAVGGLWHTLALGETYTPLVLLTALFWVSARRRSPVAAGIALGVILALKPNFALWDALLLVGGAASIAIAAAATALALIVVSSALYGTTIWLTWARVAVGTTMVQSGTNSSIDAFVTRAGLPALWLPASILLIAVICYLVRRNRYDVLSISTIGLCLSLMVSPIAWPGYTLLTVPRLHERRWTLPVLIAAVILAVPTGFVPTTTPVPIATAVIGTLYLWALFLLVVDATHVCGPDER
jgi:hypothetical protein